MSAIERVMTLIAGLVMLAIGGGCAGTKHDPMALDHEIDGVRLSFRTSDWGVRAAWAEGPGRYRAEEVLPEDRPLVVAAISKGIRRVPPLAKFLRDRDVRLVMVRRLELDQTAVAGF